MSRSRDVGSDRNLMYLFVSVVVAAALPGPLPSTPPRQSRVQVAMMEAIAARAAGASAEATPVLLQVLNTSRCRAAFHQACTNSSIPSVASATAIQLLQFLHDSINTAEIAHSVSQWAGTKGFGLIDAMNVSRARGFTPNVWQAQYLMQGSLAGASLIAENTTEMAVYAASACADVNNCTWQEASDRVFYASLGASDGRPLDRSPNPALHWGEVTLLLKGVRDMVGIAPLDTGDWSVGCTSTGSHSKKRRGFLYTSS